MIEEQFVSFDTARMLKEAGFSELCRRYYLNNGSLYISIVVDDYNGMPSGIYSCPTQGLVARWLREVHRIVVDATFILRFIIHGVVPPFPAVATKAELPWKSLCDTDTQRKSPRHGTGGLIFFPLEREGEPRLLSSGRSTTPNKSRCKYRVLLHATSTSLTTNNNNYPVKLNKL